MCSTVMIDGVEWHRCAVCPQATPYVYSGNRSDILALFPSENGVTFDLSRHNDVELAPVGDITVSWQQVRELHTALGELHMRSTQA